MKDNAIPEGGLRRGEFFMLSSTTDTGVSERFDLCPTSIADYIRCSQSARLNSMITEALANHPDELGKVGDTVHLDTVEVSKPVDGKFQVVLTFDLIPSELRDWMQETD